MKIELRIVELFDEINLNLVGIVVLSQYKATIIKCFKFFVVKVDSEKHCLLLEGRGHLKQ